MTSNVSNRVLNDPYGLAGLVSSVATQPFFTFEGLYSASAEYLRNPLPFKSADLFFKDPLKPIITDVNSGVHVTMNRFGANDLSISSDGGNLNEANFYTYGDGLGSSGIESQGAPGLRFSLYKSPLSGNKAEIFLNNNQIFNASDDGAATKSVETKLSGTFFNKLSEVGGTKEFIRRLNPDVSEKFLSETTMLGYFNNWTAFGGSMSEDKVFYNNGFFEWYLSTNNFYGNAAISFDGKGFYSNKDIMILNPLYGLVLRSPDNNSWRITIDNTGTLITTAI